MKSSGVPCHWASISLENNCHNEVPAISVGKLLNVYISQTFHTPDQRDKAISDKLIHLSFWYGILEDKGICSSSKLIAMTSQYTGFLSITRPSAHSVDKCDIQLPHLDYSFAGKYTRVANVILLDYINSISNGKLSNAFMPRKLIMETKLGKEPQYSPPPSCCRGFFLT